MQPEKLVFRPACRRIRFPCAELLAEAANVPRAKKLHILALAQDRAAAIEEWKEGVEVFIEWANRARTGETTSPAAIQADQALTAFSQGRFHVQYDGLNLSAVTAGKSILSHVRDSHWHLAPCRICSRWLLAKDQRRELCRRVECVRAARAEKKRQLRKEQRERDARILALAKSQRTF